MRLPVSVLLGDTLRAAVETMFASGLRQIAVLEKTDRFIGFVDESAVARVYEQARKTTAVADPSAMVSPN